MKTSLGASHRDDIAGTCRAVALIMQLGIKIRDSRISIRHLSLCILKRKVWTIATKGTYLRIVLQIWYKEISDMHKDSLGNRSESEDKEEIDEGRRGIRTN